MTLWVRRGLMCNTESSALTIGGTPAVNDICYFKIGRDVSMLMMICRGCKTYWYKDILYY